MYCAKLLESQFTPDSGMLSRIHVEEETLLGRLRVGLEAALEKLGTLSEWLKVQECVYSEKLEKLANLKEQLVRVIPCTQFNRITDNEPLASRNEQARTVRGSSIPNLHHIRSSHCHQRL